MRAGVIVMAALGVFGIVAASIPAQADEYGRWRRHEWREHEWREQRWHEHDRREHGWREHEWRERRAYGPPPVYVQPGYAPQYYSQPGYAPPPAYYEAPSPLGYAALPVPGVSIGFGR